MADRPRLLLLQLLGQLRCVQETLGILKELLQRAAIGTSVGVLNRLNRVLLVPQPLRASTPSAFSTAAIN